jgi:hypothetical protein
MQALRIERAEARLERRGLATKLRRASMLLLFTPLLALATIVMLRLGSDLLPVALGWTVLASPVAAFAAYLVEKLHRHRRGAVIVDARAVAIAYEGGELRVPAARLLGAQLHARDRAVDLHLAGGDVLHVRVPTLDDARSLARATGLDASRNALRVPLGASAFLDRPFSSHIFRLGFLLTFLMARVAPTRLSAAIVAIAVFATMLLALGRALLGATELVIGADGVTVRGHLRARFIAYDRLAGLDAPTPRVPGVGVLALRLVDGTTVSLTTRDLSADARVELLARYEEASRAWRPGGVDTIVENRLARRGRPVDEWRTSLRRALESAEGYRDEPLTREALLRVLASPAAPAERRIGAALALTPDRHAGTQESVLAAALACANPRLRIALEQAADGDLDEAALDEAIADEARSRLAS